jgi:hypothetical protein
MPLGFPLDVNVALEPPATDVINTVVMSPDQDFQEIPRDSKQSFMSA